MNTSLFGRRGKGRHRGLAMVFVLALVALVVPAPVLGVGQIANHGVELPDRDARTGRVQPNATQRSIVSQLGARVRWNRFGTPRSLIKYGGWLATGLRGSPAEAARGWIRTNRALFRLTDADVTRLELVSANKFADSAATAVLFRQRFGDLPAGQDGLIIVGIRDGKVGYVSSSAAGSLGAPAAAILSPTQAWLRSAADVGLGTPPSAITNKRRQGGWTIFSVDGFSTPPAGREKDAPMVDQRARLVAVPTYQRTVRAAYETVVLDTSRAEPIAYIHFVDARTGEVLMRYNRVDHATDSHVDRAEPAGAAPTFGQFAGTTSANAPKCGPDHPIPVPDGTLTIDLMASAENPAHDVRLFLLNPAHQEIVFEDTGTSPEALHYEFPTAVAASTYYARVCEPDNASLPAAPWPYEGAFATNDVASTPTDFFYPPQWKFFRANPSLANDPSADDPYDHVNTDTRVTGCWVKTVEGAAVANCTPGFPPLHNLASRIPWDEDPRTQAPTFTTRGNNARSAEAWTSPLTPGPLQQMPTDPQRHYNFPWTNVWNQSRCSPTNLIPGGNDIDAAVANLFASHNRMHDWSYFLGFTEHTWNLQEYNFGNNPGVGQEHDPEFGQAQSGALLPLAAGLSRDNANQITLQDGVPGITNMYLWQPFPGSFYAPCVDGDYDMSVIAHEYGHAISNRMAGGPDASLTGSQAGAMGESWSDLIAIEYLNEYGYVPTNDESRYAVGAYVTGNKQRGIRNYNMSNSPLNYSNVGYDFVCNLPLVPPNATCPGRPRTQVHADGEIWSAVNFDIRQALISKYNASYPASNQGLQRQCADGVRPANLCPGNRRWIQIVFDAWLLMPAGVSMLDARDAYLGADMLRFGGANQRELWLGFARRAFGIGADDDGGPTGINPTPSFASPLHSETSLRFRVFAADEGNAPITNAKIFVGRYEAGVTPVADTIPNSDTNTIGDTAAFVSGTYEFLVNAPGYGHMRFSRVVPGGGSPQTVNIFLSTNRASMHKGAVPTGAETPAEMNELIDDTEATVWTGAAPVEGHAVTVDLQGGVHNVKRVNVSAMLSPEEGGRFRALRQFEIWTCNGDAATCAVATNFTKIYTSPADAFPATRPRPVAPTLNLRSFNVPDTNATHVQLRVVDSHCTADETGFRGDQDSDPSSNSDCVTGSEADTNVRAAELQVFSSTPAVPPRDPVAAVTVSGPATAEAGTTTSFTLSYRNAGPAEAAGARLTDVLPEGLSFVSASDGGTYDASTRTVTWRLGDVNAGASGSRTVRTRVNAAAGSLLVSRADFIAPATTALPGVHVLAIIP